MARPLRILFPGAWYHVTNRGLERRPVFRTPEDADRFLALLGETSRDHGVEVHAFCLMGNHYHLLLRTPRGNLSRAMRHVDGVYTQRFNRAHGRDGPLFRGRYAAVLVQADKHLVCAARYIHLNPVEAGLVDRPEAWPLSSYAGYLDPRRAPPWLRTSFVLGWFGNPGARIRHREFVEAGLDTTTRAFFARSRRRPVLGSRTYRDEIADLLEETPEDTRLETPDVDHVVAPPTLNVLGHAVARTFDVDLPDLRDPRRRRDRRLALARGAFVDVAIGIYGHAPRVVARWLGFRRMNTAAEAARRFRERHTDAGDIRDQLVRHIAGTPSGTPSAQTSGET